MDRHRAQVRGLASLTQHLRRTLTAEAKRERTASLLPLSSVIKLYFFPSREFRHLRGEAGVVRATA